METSVAAIETVRRLRTADGLFLTGRDQRVTYWSPNAERILGVRAEDALGKPCYEVLVGIDFSGHPFCRSECPIAGNALKGRAVRDYDVIVRNNDGGEVVINNSVVLFPDDAGAYTVLHMFRPVRRPAPAKSGARRPGPRLDTGGAEYPATPLSRRETEVLRLAGTGLRTAEVATALGVSVYTARNQLSSVMRKLNARSRLDAILRARDHGLI
jgi:PAS domain S-box-containing protein